MIFVITNAKWNLSPFGQFNRLLIVAALSLATLSANSQDRSSGAKIEFKYDHPCPVNGKTKGPCPGYVIDHIIPLACGGPDQSTNMQWQTTEEAKQKDKWERKTCEN